MKILSFALVVFFTSAAFAGIEIGKYQGISEKGLCSLEVLSYSYEGGVHHPINERVTVVENGFEWTVRHPPVIDEEANKIRFNHNLFEAVVPTPAGAKFLKVIINHDVEPHAPVSYTFIEDNYKDSAKSVKEICSDLVKINF